MKAVATALALCLMVGAAFAQDMASKKSGDEEVKAAILKRVEERLKQQSEQILAEVKKMLQEHFAKATPTTPAKKQPGFLGIQGKELADGIEIVQVIKETPALKAGLAKGDVILSVNGKKVTKLQDMVSLLGEIGAGSAAKVEYRRNGKVATMSVQLTARPQDDDGDDDDGDDDDGDDDDDAPGKSNQPLSYLGIEGKDIAEGIQIVEVKKDSAAAKMGLQKDDVLTTVNGKKVGTMKDFLKSVLSVGAGKTAKIEYKRSGKTGEVTVQIQRRRDKDGDDDDDDDDR